MSKKLKGRIGYKIVRPDGGSYYQFKQKLVIDSKGYSSYKLCSQCTYKVGHLYKEEVSPKFFEKGFHYYTSLAKLHTPFLDCYFEGDGEDDYHILKILDISKDSKIDKVEGVGVTNAFVVLKDLTAEKQINDKHSVIVQETVNKEEKQSVLLNMKATTYLLEFLSIASIALLIASIVLLSSNSIHSGNIMKNTCFVASVLVWGATIIYGESLLKNI